MGVFDGMRHQFHFSNLGDSGVIVLRHIDSDVAGVLKRNREIPRAERVSDLRVAFVSQQQLKSFNHPYQLGYTGEDAEDSTSFKMPTDACTSSIHVQAGDIVILATDGLFDNVDIDDIVTEAHEWEQRNQFHIDTNPIQQNMQATPDLAKRLVWLARDKSLDDSIDSPFAILAKENDILWSGGMPDD